MYIFITKKWDEVIYTMNEWNEYWKLIGQVRAVAATRTKL